MYSRRWGGLETHYWVQLIKGAVSFTDSKRVPIHCWVDRESFPVVGPGRVAQSVGHLTRKSGVLGSIPGLSFLLSFFSRRAVVSYWRKYVHEVLANRLGGLSLPRKSVARFTDRPDMTLDVYRGRKTTIQQQQQPVVGWRNTVAISRPSGRLSAL